MKIQTANRRAIEEAAAAIRRGELVVMPTETVYGLAADALNVDAVRKIFAAKGRPADNPLIVHIAGLDEMAKVARELPPSFTKLAEVFWPGPLTLVLPKSAAIPSEVTGRLDTVAIRMPNHPVALDLIREVGAPLCAPSANPFMALSPTRAEHLDPDLMGHVSVVLDAGPCEIGLESTVLDLASPQPSILRPGAISAEQIVKILGAPLAAPVAGRRAPGQYPRHYAPRARVRLVDRASDDACALVMGEARGARHIVMASDPVQYGASLYAALHELDSLGTSEIEIEIPPTGLGWGAIHDRLQRAATS